jgi:crotonobetainyl-CoA:carnitine CoA-transferase CaiB-like acyl-CoA transferase
MLAALGCMIGRSERAAPEIEGYWEKGSTFPGAVAGTAEGVLAEAFATAPAAEWTRRLRSAGLLAELIEPLDRDAFRRKILDDPVNRQFGRIASYDTADWGWCEQVGLLVRTGPEPGVSTRLMLPRVGEHTVAVLAELGLSPAEVQDLLDAKVARQLADS